MLATLNADEIAALYWHWPFWARPDQLPPAGDWVSWLMLGGRGAGKTRAGAEWVRQRVEQADPSKAARHIALIGETYAEARAVMVEGPSGLLAVSPPDWRPKFLPSRQLLIWPNGAEARLFSSERPEALTLVSCAFRCFISTCPCRPPIAPPLNCLRLILGLNEEGWFQPSGVIRCKKFGRDLCHD